MVTMSIGISCLTHISYDPARRNPATPPACTTPSPRYAGPRTHREKRTAMKITSYQATTLRIPEDDPLANMPEEAGRTRPVVILRLRTDSGIEGIGLTFYGGRKAR